MSLKTLSVIGKRIIAVLLGTFRSSFLSFASLLIPQKLFLFKLLIFASSVKQFCSFEFFKLICFVQVFD